MGAAKAAREISVAELAKQQNVHPSTIRRRLRALARRAKKAVAYRMDPTNPRSKLFVTLPALAAANRNLVEGPEMAADDAADLRKKFVETRKELIAVKSTVKVLLDAYRELLLGEQSRAS